MAEIQNIFKTTFDNLCSSEGKNVFFKNVAKHFKTKDSPFEQNFGDDFLQKIEEYPTDKGGDNSEIFTESNYSLKKIYGERTKVTRALLITSIILILLFVIIVIYLILKSVLTNASLTDSLSLINIILAALPMFLSGGIFILYSRENDKLDKVEQDIRYIEKTVSILKIINSLKDDEIKKGVLEAFLKSIKV